MDIVDSHIHLDLIERYHPHRIQWLKDNRCGVISWAYFEGIDSVSQLNAALEAKAECVHQNAKTGLGCHYLVGIHPRSIPPDLTPDRVGSLLEPYLDDPLCLGIGEIGLETGDARECETLIAQIELGANIANREKVIGIHTPRSQKPEITGTTLELLNPYQHIASSIVIDHCTPETIASVLDAGYWAGVTLSSAKTSWEEMKQIASTHPKQIDRIMCNTDSNGQFYEDAVQCSDKNDLPEAIRQKLFRDNAARFFGLS